MDDDPLQTANPGAYVPIMGNFTPAVFTFLRELAANNNREWWEDNKERYRTVIQEPALDFIEDFGHRLKSISPHFISDPRANGGSLMRPYRDIRFSKDKTPYKTNVGIQFRHSRGKDIHAPGFYLHLQPKQCFAGAGLWTPETAVARAIRQNINDDPTTWASVAHRPDFAGHWTLGDHEEDYLKKVPPEMDPDHPNPDDLRLKSFTAGTRLTQTTVTSSDFADELMGLYAITGPYVEFLCRAIDIPF
jgi:uncharacterized protein (TIGR02453 family)